MKEGIDRLMDQTIDEFQTTTSAYTDNTRRWRFDDNVTIAAMTSSKIEFKTKKTRTMATMMITMQARATNKHHAKTVRNNKQTRLVVLILLLPPIWRFNVIQNRIQNKED